VPGKKLQKVSPKTRAIVSKKKQRAFLEALAITGKVNDSAYVVGYKNPSFLYKLRNEDEDFREAWDLALQDAGHSILDHAVTMARDGVVKEIRYRGAVIGHETQYSERLIMFLLKGLMPEKFANNRTEGGLNVNFGVAVLPVQAPNEGAWEERASIVHDNQEVITLDQLPSQKVPLKSKRGD
jgi:hypothetical protein